MRKLIYLIFITFSLTLQAQNGYKHINLDAGINISGDQSYNLAIEFNKGTFSAWEISAQAHFSDAVRMDSIAITTGEIMDTVAVESPITKELYLLGVYYKPLMFKKKNLVMNFRYGLLLGREETFAAAAGGGFELTYHLPSLIGIYLKQSNHYIINVDQRWRHSINVGIKIPF